MEKRTIWNETDSIEIDDIRDDYPDCTDAQLAQIANELHYEYLQDERINLNIPTKNPIVCFADLGFWNRRQRAWAVLGTNIKDIMQRQVEGSCSDCHWYYDPETDDICGSEAHHDNTNYYTYREVPQAVLDEVEEDESLNNWEYLMEHSTTIADRVKAVYGW